MLRRAGFVIVALSMLLSTVCLGTTHATILKFDDLSGWDFIPVDYGGLTWNESWWSVGEGGGYGAYSSPNYASSLAGMEADGVVYDWTGLNYIVFQTPGTFQGAYFAGPDSFVNSIGYDLYYQESKVWSTADVLIHPTPAFVASNYDGLVDRVLVRGVQGFFAMDDFSLNEAATVPTPGALLLLASGLGGCALLRNRLGK
jgi:hypothetical protein